MSGQGSFVPTEDFYPRPPRGGRLAHRQKFLTDEIFLSTPSARRATYRADAAKLGVAISIHALREEGDLSFSMTFPTAPDFYPRPPRGGRPSNPTGASGF